jgi:hypothetical protein
MYAASPSRRPQREEEAGAAAAGGAAYNSQPATYPRYYQGAAPPVYVYGGNEPSSVPPPTMAGAGKPPSGRLDDWDLEAAQAAATESAYMEKAQAALRLSFMRKVYGILLTQLLTTIGVACLFMFEGSVNAFVTSSPRLLITGLVLSVVVLIALVWCVVVRSYSRYCAPHLLLRPRDSIQDHLIHAPPTPTSTQLLAQALHKNWSN